MLYFSIFIIVLCFCLINLWHLRILLFAIQKMSFPFNDSNRDLTNMVMPGSFSYSYLLALGLIRISKQAPFGENLQDLL
jgi:hypothetical protein